jgi:hypothetical protein
MAHNRLEFIMPARADVVFDAFHYRVWRRRWDSLVSDTRVVGGAPCPSVGAVTENTGGGWLRALSMRTQFVSYERPRLAAAAMLGRSFPFARWAASMRHRPLEGGGSLMIYTYSFETAPRALHWLMEPLVRRIFERQTRKRFARLQRFLAGNAAQVEAWQARLGDGEAAA